MALTLPTVFNFHTTICNVLCRDPKHIYTLLTRRWPTVNTVPNCILCRQAWSTEAAAAALQTCCSCYASCVDLLGGRGHIIRVLTSLPQITHNINYGSVPFSYISKPWQHAQYPGPSTEIPTWNAATKIAQSLMWLYYQSGLDSKALCDKWWSHKATTKTTEF